MAKPRSMSASIGDWGDLTRRLWEKNVQHNAREAQLDRKEREESHFIGGKPKKRSDPPATNPHLG
jgi:hypothetical protein